MRHVRGLRVLEEEISLERTGRSWSEQEEEVEDKNDGNSVVDA